MIDAVLDTSGPERALELIGGKWKMPILHRLSLRSVWRYGELKQELGAISHKMLSQQLKELERAGLIIRTMYPVVPPKVEYAISERGKLTLPVIESLCRLYRTISSHTINETRQSTAVTQLAK